MLLQISKSQVTIEYDDNGKPVRIDTIVVSTQHDEFILPADNTKEAQLKAAPHSHFRQPDEPV